MTGYTTFLGSFLLILLAFEACLLWVGKWLLMAVTD
jgi:hypothetical protein